MVIAAVVVVVVGEVGAWDIHIPTRDLHRSIFTPNTGVMSPSPQEYFA
jgi:hypothetical protein